MGFPRSRSAIVTAAVLTSVLSAGCGLVPHYATPEEMQQVQQLSGNSYSFAVNAFDSGDSNAGEGALKQAVSFLGGGVDAYVSVGQKLVEQNYSKEAVRLLSGAIKDKSVTPDASFWATLATAYEKIGDQTGAANANAQAEQSAEAVMAGLGKTISKNDTDPATQETALRFLQTGLYYDQKNDTPRALRAVREARRLSPDNPGILNTLGYILADKGSSRSEFDEAVHLTRAAVEAVPNSAEILDSYGWALFKTGNLAGARRVLRQAADLKGSSGEIRYHLGVVYGQLGQIADARLELDRATVLRKDYKEAEEAKKHLRQPPGQGVVEGA